MLENGETARSSEDVWTNECDISNELRANVISSWGWNPKPFAFRWPAIAFIILETV